ncbi:MAG: hypothetical protein U1F57_03935 [bacterium]
MASRNASNRNTSPVASRSYWDYFTDFDIPVWERMLTGALLPIALPAILLSGLTGCGARTALENESPAQSNAEAGFTDTVRESSAETDAEAGASDTAVTDASAEAETSVADVVNEPYVPVCGNGLEDPPEQCDDPTPGSCCDDTCHLLPAGTTCDDHDPRTVEDTCNFGVCAGRM